MENKLEIRIEDYLSQEEMRNIAIEEYRDALRRNFRTEKDVERVLINTSYRYVWDEIDCIYQENGIEFEPMLKQKIISLIDELSSFNVFRSADRFDGNSVGQEMLDQIVKDSHGLIQKRVEEIINKYNFTELKEEIADTVYECICQKFTEK